jgi:hypothetical protein
MIISDSDGYTNDNHINIRSGFSLYAAASDSSGILILRDEIELMFKLTKL